MCQIARVAGSARRYGGRLSVSELRSPNHDFRRHSSGYRNGANSGDNSVDGTRNNRRIPECLGLSFLDASGNLHIAGNLLVDGTKSSTARLQSGQQVALYAVESSENWFEDFGTAELKSGVAWVPLDATFAETTNPATSYHVFLTPNGDSNGLYVARKTAAGFEVREHAGGGSNVAFDYRIVVRRRGYETLRLADVQHDVKTLESSRRHLAELTNSGTLTKAVASRPAGITPARITPPPTVRRVAPRPIDPQLPRLNVPQAR